jgi:hypothetical protein
VRLALAEAESAAVPMRVVRDRLMTGIARGYGELNWSALGLIAAEEAGALASRSAGALNPARIAPRRIGARPVKLRR